MSDLEARVAKLEAHIEHIRSDVGEMRPALQDIRERFAKLETTVGALPTKGYISTAVVGAITMIGAFLLFQGQIQALFGLVPALPQ